MIWKGVSGLDKDIVSYYYYTLGGVGVGGEGKVSGSNHVC
jgi:hypothetical protein